MNSIVEDIKSRINIVDLVEEYLKLQKAGTNWKAPCPFHKEKTPSFMVSEEKQIWHCFGCGKGGDVFGFLMEMEGINFKEALKILAEKTGVKLSEHGFQKGDDRNKIIEILELAAKFYEKQLWQGMGKDKILNYLKERSLKNETIQEFRLGYAPPGWRNLLAFLLERGYETKDIAKTGLLVQKAGDFQIQNPDHYDRFRDRVMFPITDAMGKVIGFSARVAPGGDESQAKYINTPETLVYHKGHVLYGIDKAKQEIKNKKFALIVEGNMDVIASYQAGIKNTVAISGTALTSEQLDILKRYADKIKMLFDMDSAGEEATLRSAELCFRKDINVHVVRLPRGKDAAEAVKENPQDFLRAVEQSIPAMEYIFAKIPEKYDRKSAEGKKAIAREMLNFVKHMSSEIEKNHWIKKIAQELGIEDRILIDALNKSDKKAGKDKGGRREDEENLIPKTRAENIREKLVGLILSEPSVWKRALERYKDHECVKDDELLGYIFEKGQEADFKVENILLMLDDKYEKEKIRRACFEGKYKFAENGGAEENSPEDIWLSAEKHFQELVKENNREKLKIIIQNIQKAEQEGNKKELNFLISEFSRISRQLK